MKTHARLWYDQNLLCATKKTGRRGQFAQLTNLEPHGTYPKKHVLFHMLFLRSHCGHRILAMTSLEQI